MPPKLDSATRSDPNGPPAALIDLEAPADVLAEVQDHHHGMPGQSAATVSISFTTGDKPTASILIYGTPEALDRLGGAIAEWADLHTSDERPARLSVYPTTGTWAIMAVTRQTTRTQLARHLSASVEPHSEIQHPVVGR